MLLGKTNFVILTILLPLASLAVTSIPQFCQSPVNFICSGRSYDEYQKIRSSLYQEAMEKTVKTYPELKIKDQVLDLKSIQSEKEDEVQAQFYSALLSSFENLLIKNDLIFTNNDLLAMKSQVGNFAALYYDDNSLSKLISSINIITTKSQYAKFVDQLPLEIKSNPSVSTFYDRVCGNLVSQAHAEKSQNMIIICPGFILKALTQKPTQELRQVKKTDLIRSLSFLLSHEMSHALDMNISMGTFYSCLQKNSLFKRAEFSFEKRREIYADFFAYNQLAEEMKKLKTVAERIELTKQNLQGLCDSTTSIDHPTMQFRINVLLNYSVISSQLGCETKAQNQCQ